MANAMNGVGPGARVVITHEPEAKDVDLNRQTSYLWKRASGQDAAGKIYREHQIEVRDKTGKTYSFNFKITDQEEKTEVIALKALRNTMKSLSTDMATKMHKRITEDGEMPVIKIIKDKDDNILAAVPVFQGNQETGNLPYCFLKDGTMLKFTKDGTNRLDDGAINDVLIERYKGSMWNQIGAYFSSSVSEGDVGYHIQVQHMRGYQEAQGKLDHTRDKRADGILTHLQQGDVSQMTATKVGANANAPLNHPAGTPTGSSSNASSRRNSVDDDEILDAEIIDVEDDDVDSLDGSIEPLTSSQNAASVLTGDVTQVSDLGNATTLAPSSVGNALSLQPITDEQRQQAAGAVVELQALTAEQVAQLRGLPTDAQVSTAAGHIFQSE